MWNAEGGTGGCQKSERGKGEGIKELVAGNELGQKKRTFAHSEGAAKYGKGKVVKGGGRETGEKFFS